MTELESQLSCVGVQSEGESGNIESSYTASESLLRLVRRDLSIIGYTDGSKCDEIRNLVYHMQIKFDVILHGSGATCIFKAIIAGQSFAFQSLEAYDETEALQLNQHVKDSWIANGFLVESSKDDILD